MHFSAFFIIIIFFNLKFNFLIFFYFFAHVNLHLKLHSLNSFLTTRIYGCDQTLPFCEEAGPQTRIFLRMFY